jgi:hypothetical protein
MTKHTPGPWELIWEDGKYGVIGAQTEKKLVAIVGNNPDDGLNDIRKANAALIAAAPDMLAALEATEEYVQMLALWIDGSVALDVLENKYNHTQLLRQTAIAKAKGESE